MLTEDKLDSFIKLLKEAENTQDLKQLTIIQESLENLSKKLKSNTEKSEDHFVSEEITKKLKEIEELIVKLDTSKRVGNELFQEFKEYIDNRKIK